MLCAWHTVVPLTSLSDSQTGSHPGDPRRLLPSSNKFFCSSSASLVSVNLKDLQSRRTERQIGSSLSRGCCLAAGFGLVEEVVVEAGAGVGDLDADEAAVFPVERGEPAGAGRHGGLDGGAARRE